MLCNSPQHCVWITFICSTALIALCCCAVSESDRGNRAGTRGAPVCQHVWRVEEIQFPVCVPFHHDNACLTTHKSQNFYPDKRGNGQEKGQTDGKKECSVCGVFKVASGCNATSAPAGMKPETHVRVKETVLYSETLVSPKRMLHNLHGKNTTETNPSESATKV